MAARHRMAAAAAAAGAITALGLATATAASAQPSGPVSYLSHFSKLSTIASTVPHNGDVNPYGIFVVRHSTGRLRAGDVLISNFNDKANQQGTGKTIVEISPGGHRSLFASVRRSMLPGSCPGGVGLTTALEVLPGGWVVVGSTPSSNGMAATAKAGCLIVLNSMGKVAETISGYGINGPWDSTAVLRGQVADLFVTNVLNGTVAAGGKVVHRGTVLRLASDAAPLARADADPADDDRIRVRSADQRGRLRSRPDGRRARPPRHAVRGRDAEQPDHRDPERADPARQLPEPASC